MKTAARHNPSESRYELVGDDGIVSIAEYDLAGDTVVFTHTETVEELRNQGFAAQLVRFALDDVRLTGRRVVPRCPFVRNFIGDNPQYGDLLAA